MIASGKTPRTFANLPATTDRLSGLSADERALARAYGDLLKPLAVMLEAGETGSAPENV